MASTPRKVKPLASKQTVGSARPERLAGLPLSTARQRDLAVIALIERVTELLDLLIEVIQEDRRNG
jgi:hypothetical protein